VRQQLRESIQDGSEVQHTLAWQLVGMQGTYRGTCRGTYRGPWVRGGHAGGGGSKAAVWAGGIQEEQ